jgi:putative transposase
MWRWVERGQIPTYERPSYELSAAELAAYARLHGNAAAVQQELHPTRPELLRTMQRAFSKLTPAEQAMVRRGVAARRAEELNVLQSISSTRRNELWVADHSQLNCLVLPTRSTKPRRPWSTMFIDSFSRCITGWALSLQPTHATVLATFRRAVLPNHDPAQAALRGRPEMLQTDNGLEFTADDVTTAVNLLGGSARAVRRYSPHLNGIIERVHRTMDSTWLAGTPFYSDAARTHDGRHSRPKGFLPPPFEEFVADFAGWVRRYNCERPHSALDGQVPLEVWEADATPLVVPDESLVDWMLEPGVPRVVRDYGIELGGWYCHPTALHDYEGKTVDVRVPINEAHFIDVYDGARKICRATRQADWSEDERAAFLAGRRHGRRRINKAKREADAVHVEALNQRRALRDDEEQAQRDALTSADGALRRSSDTSLLDLDLDAAA